MLLSTLRLIIIWGNTTTGPEASRCGSIVNAKAWLGKECRETLREGQRHTQKNGITPMVTRRCGVAAAGGSWMYLGKDTGYAVAVG